MPYLGNSPSGGGGGGGTSLDADSVDESKIKFASGQSDGIDGQVLSSDGAGDFTWETIAAGGGKVMQVKSMSTTTSTSTTSSSNQNTACTLSITLTDSAESVKVIDNVHAVF